MAVIACIECDEEIAIEGRARLGQQITCLSCGAQLEVVSTNPLELDWAYDDDDWDNEGDEFDGEEFDDDDLDDDFDDDEFEDDALDAEEEDETDKQWR